MILESGHPVLYFSWAASSEFGTYRLCELREGSGEPAHLLAHTSSESRGTFRQKARSLAPLNGWACTVKICHDRMLEDTNSLDAAQLIFNVNTASPCVNQTSMNIYAKALSHIFLGPRQTVKIQIRRRRTRRLIRVYTVCLQNFYSK